MFDDIGVAPRNVDVLVSTHFTFVHVCTKFENGCTHGQIGASEHDRWAGYMPDVSSMCELSYKDWLLWLHRERIARNVYGRQIA